MVIDCHVQPSEFAKLTLAQFFSLLKYSDKEKNQEQPVSYKQILEYTRKYKEQHAIS